MNTAAVIESFGVLIKEETLQTVEHNIAQNTLVLESLEPFPGYLGQNMPVKSIPEALFFITEVQYPDEMLLRISQQLCEHENLVIDACPVEIILYHISYFGIRIKGLFHYNQIAEIQQLYTLKDVQFMKKKEINAPGLMKLSKVFLMAPMADNIYRNIENEAIYYLEIPAHLDWEMFRKLTVRVKNNVENSNFDCATCFIYHKKIRDFIRIYAPNLAVEKLQHIRQKYLEEMARVQDDTL
jgi:hypothetical protein